SISGGVLQTQPPQWGTYANHLLSPHYFRPGGYCATDPYVGSSSNGGVPAPSEAMRSHWRGEYYSEQGDAWSAVPGDGSRAGTGEQPSRMLAWTAWGEEAAEIQPTPFDTISRNEGGGTSIDQLPGWPLSASAPRGRRARPQHHRARRVAPRHT
ncbi:hypothetical protein CYMTET_53895, partial [Cymbomonas tetramitiformis]